ncbi:SLC26A/SulP transporter domain, partial [Dillenia turbinata]
MGVVTIKDVHKPQIMRNKTLQRPPKRHCLVFKQSVCLAPARSFFFSIFHWLPTHKFSLLRSDVVPGLTIASFAIPQHTRKYQKGLLLEHTFCIATSDAYTSLFPLLVYVFLWNSKHLAVGPVSIASMVMASVLGENVVEEPEQYLKLALTAKFFTGVFQASQHLL